MLVDTGASCSLIDVDLLKKVFEGHKLIIRDTDCTASQADESPIDVVGEVDLAIDIGGCPYFLTALVASLGNDSFILGLDFLERQKAIIDISRGYVQLGSREIFLNRNGHGQCCRVKVKESVEIPPDKAVWISSHPDDKRWASSQKCGVVEVAPSFVENTKLFVSRALVEPTNPTLVVLNTSGETVKLKAGTTIGLMHPVMAVDVTSDNGNFVKTGPVESDQKLGDTDNVNFIEQVPEHLRALVDDVSNDLTIEQRNQFAELLISYQDIFLEPGGKLGYTTLIRHQVDTGDHPPVKCAARRFPPDKEREIDQLVDEMIQQGVVSESTSPWSSPVVLVTKKDGSTRFCVDYRKLNLCQKDRIPAYPLPCIDDALDSLAGSCWFSSLDLASGYW